MLKSFMGRIFLSLDRDYFRPQFLLTDKADLELLPASISQD